MNKEINLLWKLCLITIILFSWTTKSNAQFITSSTEQSKILPPIVKIVSNFILESKSNIENELDQDKSYLNSSLFFFKENIQVCKDILTGTNDSVLNTSSQMEKQILTKKDTILTDKKIKENKKRKHKSLWNHPGNIKLKI